MNKKLSSYEKTELIYKQILADEQKVHTYHCSNFCTPVHKRILKTFRWADIVMGTYSRSALNKICMIML